MWQLPSLLVSITQSALHSFWLKCFYKSRPCSGEKYRDSVMFSVSIPPLRRHLLWLDLIAFWQCLLHQKLCVVLALGS